MWPWYLSGLLIVAGISAYDNLSTVRGWFRAQSPHAVSNQIASRDLKKREGVSHTAAIPAPGPRPVEEEALASRKPSPAGLMPPQDIPAIQPVALQAGAKGPFYFCTDQKTNCVVDGGHFWLKGQKIALADVSLPQMKKAKCDAERERGSQAKRRLREILNAGEFKLLAANGTSGGQMHVVLSDGSLASDRLIAEGLAHAPKDAAKPWC
jgi:endonuclease YncB( thermonuclease family)